MAAGLLVVCLGKATKFADSYQAMTKSDRRDDTAPRVNRPRLDADTPVSESKEWRHVTDAMLQSAAEGFLGDPAARCRPCFQPLSK